MYVWEGLIIGFLGSLHCIGMCGPIALALPSGSFRSFSFYIGRILYNFGRVITYSFFGLIFGMLGKSFSFISIEFQQGVTIATGVVILLIIILPSGVKQKISDRLSFINFTNKIKSYFSSLFKKGSLGSLFFIGILNGFLPCGFVYLGLAGALVTGEVSSGIFYMALFGLGTIPVMFGTALAGNFINVQVRQKLSRAIPYFAGLIAILFILRGLSLGIPYISPKTEKINKMFNKESGEKKPPCCQ
ncbi:MAG: sulfite exporter TauE/SafE family protein [Ignavibacteria bacterium]